MVQSPEGVSLISIQPVSERLMQNILLNLKFALRRLRNLPGFTATTILMLAFGIGSTTLIFSIVEGVLLRPLPFPEPDRLVILGDHLQGDPVASDDGWDTAPDVLAYTRYTRSFKNLGGFGSGTYELSSTGDPVQVNASRLSAGVFPALGITPLFGRIFTPQEDEQSQQVVVLSYATWQSRFQGDLRILGSKILLDRKPYVVIGVMPRNFEFPLMPGRLNRSELWVPMSFTSQEITSGAGNWAFQMLGRLKPGVTTGQARTDTESVAQEIMRNYPAAMASLHIHSVVIPLQENTVSQARPLVRILFLAVTVVLLIACANFAGLQLVCALRRQREIAVSQALGAPASALVSQAILESLVLSVSGGVTGLLLASIVLHVGKRFLPESLPRISEIGLNWAVVAFALLLAIVTGVLCGLPSAFAALRTNLNETLQEGGRSGSAGGRHTRLRSTLVIAETAIALVLLTASGLLLRSFEKMRSVDLGYRPAHIATAAYALPQQEYTNQPAIDTFNKELLLRLQQIPGQQSAALTDLLPASGNEPNRAFTPEGYLRPKDEDLSFAEASTVIGDYFSVMGITLLRGRIFTEQDRADTQLVVIVNRRLAQHYWPNQNPIGKRLHLGPQQSQSPWLTIVGEIADIKLSSPDAEAQEELFLPLYQVPATLQKTTSPPRLTGNSGYVVLRSSLPPVQMEEALRATVHYLDPQLLLTQVQSMEQNLSSTEVPRRFNTTIISGFAAVAVLLAILGIYSVIAFTVTSRMQEMAIRMALGAQRSRIIRQVLTSGVILAAIGCGIGFMGALAVSGLLRSFLFGVSPFDPMVLVLAVIAILLLALVASALPAKRAASIDPILALRSS
jgi:putative ABC transport system permease protein